MRPVNLLPQSARPYEASGKGGVGSYVVIGVLAALVIAAAAYVLTVNQITDRKNEISSAQQQAQVAQSKASGLEKYAEFSQVASTRVSDVGQLAVGRIDYERMLREMARVLPDGVWLNTLDAEATGTGSSSSTSSSTSTTPTTNPTVEINGCAPSQDAVATTLVRLRALHGSGDVQLNDSSKPLSLGGGAAGGSSGANSGSGCGSNDYAFDILVTLNSDITGVGDYGRKVPATLGGGS
jgi:Tfp pilus assembly protein PilN